MKTLPEHGVLIQFKGTGIYLIGDSGVGKSEAALQLIYQGAALICDDAPDFSIDISSNKILGACPEGFHGLMHIRDLGIIDLKELIGQQAFKAKQTIDFVIELKATDTQKPQNSDQNAHQLLSANYKKWHYQSCSVSGIRLHLSPNRNLSVIIHTAIKHFKRHHQ